MRRAGHSDARSPRRGGAGRRVAAAVVALLAALAFACAALLATGVVGLPGLGASPDGASAPAAARGAASRTDATVLDRESTQTEVTLLMVGDVLVHQGVWQSGEHADGTRSYDHLFAQVEPEVSSAGVAIVNQETILGGTGLGLSGYPLFNGPQEIGDAEVAAGFDVVLHATNHALDKGQEGIDATLGFWRESHPDTQVLGISREGEGHNGMCVVERDGVRVAVLNYTFSTNGLPLPDFNPDAVSMLSEERIASDVALVREQGADFVVACPHWGEEYQSAPNDSQRRWASVFAENGVDVVIGTHPHVLQPVEVVERPDGGSMLVFWSLGNFVSTQPTAPTMVGGMAKVRLVKGQGGCEVAGWELVPVVTQRVQGISLTSYPLATYTEELAAGNGIRGVDGSVDFTRAWVVDHCSEVLGPDFDREACVLRGGEGMG